MRLGVASSHKIENELFVWFSEQAAAICADPEI